MDNGRWAIWPERMFVTYKQMRMRLLDTIANGEMKGDPDAVSDLGADQLVEHCGDFWTFTNPVEGGQPAKHFDDFTGGDFDYSMNW